NSVNYTNAAFVGALSGIGSTSALATAGLTGADSARVATINASLPIEANLFSGGYRQSGKEFMGHLRLPFLISDEFSFDIGGSWDLGGINEVSDLHAEYTGTNGALEINTGGKGTPNAFSISQPEHSGFLDANRSVFGGDAQIYLSVLPFGGSIIK